MKEKVALFYNPVAGGGLFKNKLDQVIAQMQMQGLQVIPYRINRHEQLKSQMAQVEPEKYHAIIAAGGDGTVHSVMNEMIKCGINVPLGIFPEGTANDVANYLQIPKHLEGYCRVISDGKVTNVDAGWVNNNYFINVASAGFLTEIAHEVKQNYKNVLGKTAYYLKTLEKMPQRQPLNLRLTIDEKKYELQILLFLILNSGTAGGFQGIMPPGKMNDGVFDFIAIKYVPIHKLANLVFKLNKGQLLQDDNIFHCQGKKFLVDVEPSVNTDLDGEEGPGFPWELKVCPNILPIMTP